MTAREPGAVKRERVALTLQGAATDRPPVSFWHHFPARGSGVRLGRAAADFASRFDVDIAKVMPDIPYPVPWRSIGAAEDWLAFDAWDTATRSRFTAGYVAAVHTMRQALGPDIPLVATVYAPLTSVMKAAGSPAQFLAHADSSPELVHTALANITVNLRRHVTDLIAAGADGIYLSVQGASRRAMTSAQFREYGRPYDLTVLRAAVDGWLNVVHVHGDAELCLEEVDDYPVEVLSWSDRVTGQPLSEQRARSNRCLMGGWDERHAGAGPTAAQQLRTEAESALAAVGGRGLILAPGCSVPDDTPEDHLTFLRGVIDTLGSPAVTR